MADTDDALKHFLTSATDDPYTLLDLPAGPASSEKDIRSAWKKTALRYHPDKLRSQAKESNFDEAEANRLYILRQDAYGILSEPHLREQYDASLRAKEQKKQRDAAFSGRRREMKEALERREGVAAKRKRGEMEEEEVQERELERLRRDGMRRRRERAEMLRRQAEEEEREREDGMGSEQEVKTNGISQAHVQDIDRVVKLRFPVSESTAHLTRDRIFELFSRFGAIEAATLKEKKIKVDGEKHRKTFTTVAVIFESIVGAHAAVSDFAQVAEREQSDWQLLERPEWASGREPECIPNGRPQPPRQQQSSTPTLTNGTTNGSNGGVDDILMIRLKNAEKKRREDKKRREEEAAAAAADASSGDGGAAAPPTKRPMPSFATFKVKAAETNGGDDTGRREAEKKRLEEQMRREEAEEERMENGIAA